MNGFIHHQLEPDLTPEMGRAFTERFAALGLTDASKVVTTEVSVWGERLG